jgi:hypothetical protein
VTHLLRIKESRETLMPISHNRYGGLMAHCKDERNSERLNVQMRRIRGNLKMNMTEGESLAMDIRVILHDLSNKGAGIFSNQKLLQGHTVEFTLENHPDCLIKGKVVWSQEHHLGSHIVSATPFIWRAGISFTFDSMDGEMKLNEVIDLLSLEPIGYPNP